MTNQETLDAQAADTQPPAETRPSPDTERPPPHAVDNERAADSRPGLGFLTAAQEDRVRAYAKGYVAEVVAPLVARITAVELMSDDPSDPLVDAEGAGFVLQAVIERFTAREVGGRCSGTTMEPVVAKLRAGEVVLAPADFGSCDCIVCAVREWVNA